jgi:hypothetical protein
MDTLLRSYKRTPLWPFAFFLTLALALGVASTARAAEVDRLYVIDCGWAHASGVPIDFADNCYPAPSRSSWRIRARGLAGRRRSAQVMLVAAGLGVTFVP